MQSLPRLTRVPARLQPEHPPSNQGREGLPQLAPARSSSRIYTRFPSRTCSRWFLSAIARDHRPNCVPGRLEEAVRGIPLIGVEPAECVRQCRNAVENLCTQKGHHRQFQQKSNSQTSRCRQCAESHLPPASTAHASIHRYSELCTPSS